MGRTGTAGRLLLIALFAELGFASLNLSTMPVYLRESRGFGEAAVGIVLGTFLATEAVAKIFTGRWADRYGTRPLLILGPLLSVGSILLTFFAPRGNGAAWETVILAGLRMMDGLGAAMVWPSLFAAMAGTTSREERGRGMASLNACYLIGIALAFPIAGGVNDVARNPAAGLMVAMALFVIAASVSLTVHPPVSHTESSEKIDLRTPKTLLVVGFFAFAGIGFPSFVVKLFPMDEFRLTESQVGWLVLPVALILAALAGPAGRASDRFGRRRTVLGGLSLAIVGTGILGIAAWVPELRSLTVLAIAAPLVGTGFLVALPAWYAFAGGETGSAARLGAVMAAQGLGAIIAAPIGAGMYEKLQPFGVAHGLGVEFAHWSPFAAASASLLFAAVLLGIYSSRR